MVSPPIDSDSLTCPLQSNYKEFFFCWISNYHFWIKMRKIVSIISKCYQLSHTQLKSEHRYVTWFDNIFHQFSSVLENIDLNNYPSHRPQISSPGTICCVSTVLKLSKWPVLPWLWRAAATAALCWVWWFLIKTDLFLKNAQLHIFHNQKFYLTDHQIAVLEKFKKNYC